MQLLCEEPMVFVCRTDHLLAHRDAVGVAELCDEDLIGFPPEFGLRRLVDGAFTAAGVSARVSHEVALEYSIAGRLVRHGLGTIIMPASEAAHYPDLRAIDIRPAIPWKIYLASAEKSRLGPASAKLAEFLLASARPAQRTSR
ncbi:LysR family transcriptional regulator [Mycolicibacterium conceptionense]|uniref:LysR family transcriptional regulator n=2 Tax=Mycolicibacterium conceptionense TaxID=451644 RepID=A0A0U1DF02_9MYCO|nr:LysR family transcriptional regulator [Mycolicibacterium conceptionense]